MKSNKKKILSIALLLADGMRANGDSVVIEFNDHRAIVKRINDIYPRSK
jgi:hypothetical protein